MAAPETAELLRDAARYRSTAVVSAVRLTGSTTWHTARGSALHAPAGDWLLDDGTSTWTLAADIFERNYRRRPDGRYAKQAAVEAVRLRRGIEVPTLEGTARAEPGDWLLRGEGGELWPVPDEHFRAYYRPA